jgi:acyl-CoA synthetase (AMP-forming)/AMP-acid ligase II
LGEIEAAIRRLSGVQGVVAVGWPLTDSGVEGIEVFLEAERFDTADLTMQLRQSLPGYMLPRNIRFLDRFPTNTNGKCDRKGLQAILGSDLARVEDGCALSLVA